MLLGQANVDEAEGKRRNVKTMATVFDGLWCRHGNKELQ